MTISVTRYPVLVDGVKLKPECLVYGLVDPREPERIRYVGKTAQAPILRYIQHLQSTGSGSGWLRRSWLSMLKKARRQPTMVLLERVKDEANLAEREIHWIRAMQDAGQADINERAPDPATADQRARAAIYRKTGIMPPKVGA